MQQNNAQRADEPEQQQGRRPADTAKVGNVEIAIWRNQGANGDFYTASPPTIRYKDNTTGEFKDGSSYGRSICWRCQKPRARPVPRYGN
jgi:hypothetical protein